MKTTLVIEDALVERVRQLAKERGVSMSSVVEEAIVRLLAAPPARANGGRRSTCRASTAGVHLVDITDRKD